MNIKRQFNLRQTNGHLFKSTYCHKDYMGLWFEFFTDLRVLSESPVYKRDRKGLFF